MTPSDHSDLLPDETSILDYINNCPTPPTVRDIARAFKLPQEMRAPLRKMLRQMGEAGKIDRKEGRRVAVAGQLPEVTVLEVTGFDEHGDGVARPAGNHAGPLPDIRLLMSRKAGRAPGVGQSVLARLSKTGPTQYEARIIRVLERQQRRLFGVVQDAGGRFTMAPAERGKREAIALKTSADAPCRPGDLIEAELLPARGYLGKSARVIRNLGPADEKGAFSALALAEFGIRHSFDKDVITEADRLKKPTTAGRTDLRDVPFVTIDGADARDFDDAVFAEADDNGGWRLLVAIADVSHYVHPDSALDSEARRRGNSVYLPDMVVPMLPEAISNDLCSLRPGENRAAMVAEIFIDSAGQTIRHSIFRGLIRSAARLTYDQVQTVFDGTMDERDIGVEDGVLHNLIAAWRALDLARQQREPLALNLKERRVILDDAGQAVGIAQRAQNEAQRLIEDFMITANVAAAETLISARHPCVFRVHDQPDPAKTESLPDLAKAVGATFARGQVLRPRHFNALLQHVQGSDDELMVNEAVLRSQAKAIYSTDNVGHFGLSLRNYAHFTSPIRRYADLLVHRALVDASTPKSSAKDGLNGMPIDVINEVCKHISETEATAAAAERRTIDRFAASLFQSRVNDVVTGIIAGVTGYGAFVRLEDGAADGFLPISALPDDYYVLGDGGQALEGRHTGWRFSAGTVLRVQIKDVTPISGGILLEWIDGGTPDSSRRGARNGTSSRKARGRHRHSQSKKQRGRAKQGKGSARQKRG